MSNIKSYTVKTTVFKITKPTEAGDSVHFKINVEGGGFVGTAEAFRVSDAFEKAFQDLMEKVSEAAFSKT